MCHQVLEATGTAAQKERWLQPIVRGEVRSATWAGLLSESKHCRSTACCRTWRCFVKGTTAASSSARKTAATVKRVINAADKHPCNLARLQELRDSFRFSQFLVIAPAYQDPLAAPAKPEQPQPSAKKRAKAGPAL